MRKLRNLPIMGLVLWFDLIFRMKIIYYIVTLFMQFAYELQPKLHTSPLYMYMYFHPRFKTILTMLLQYHDNNPKATPPPLLHSLFFKWHSSLNTVFNLHALATHLLNTTSNFTIHRPVCISMDPLQGCVEFPGDLLGPRASVYLI